jgi:hypothetical protein
VQKESEDINVCDNIYLPKNGAVLTYETRINFLSKKENNSLTTMKYKVHYATRSTIEFVSEKNSGYNFKFVCKDGGVYGFPISFSQLPIDKIADENNFIGSMSKFITVKSPPLIIPDASLITPEYSWNTNMGISTSVLGSLLPENSIAIKNTIQDFSSDNNNGLNKVQVKSDISFGGSKSTSPSISIPLLTLFSFEYSIAENTGIDSMSIKYSDPKNGFSVVWRLIENVDPTPVRTSSSQ